MWTCSAVRCCYMKTIRLIGGMQSDLENIRHRERPANTTHRHEEEAQTIRRNHVHRLHVLPPQHVRLVVVRHGTQKLFQVVTVHSYPLLRLLACLHRDNACRPHVTRTLRTDQTRSEEHTSELQSRFDLVCRLLLEKQQTNTRKNR